MAKFASETARSRTEAEEREKKRAQVDALRSTVRTIVEIDDTLDSKMTGYGTAVEQAGILECIQQVLNKPASPPTHCLDLDFPDVGTDQLADRIVQEATEEAYPFKRPGRKVVNIVDKYWGRVPVTHGRYLIRLLDQYGEKEAINAYIQYFQNRVTNRPTAYEPVMKGWALLAAIETDQGRDASYELNEARMRYEAEVGSRRENEFREEYIHGLLMSRRFEDAWELSFSSGTVFKKFAYWAVREGLGEEVFLRLESERDEIAQPDKGRMLLDTVRMASVVDQNFAESLLERYQMWHQENGLGRAEGAESRWEMRDETVRSAMLSQIYSNIARPSEADAFLKAAEERLSTAEDVSVFSPEDWRAVIDAEVLAYRVPEATALFERSKMKEGDPPFLATLLGIRWESWRPAIQALLKMERDQVTVSKEVKSQLTKEQAMLKSRMNPSRSGQRATQVRLLLSQLSGIVG